MAEGITSRALIGWMEERSAMLAMAGQWEEQSEPTLANLERYRAAVGAVGELPPLEDQRGALETPGPALEEHLEGFWTSPAYAALADERWSAAVADLTRIIAMQPVTSVVPLPDDPPHANDIAAIARLTLPLDAPTGPPATFDAKHRWWVVASDSANLRVRQDFASTEEGFGMTLGFHVALHPSYLRVVLVQGRLVLSDGYRRVLGLLAAGITKAPVLVRELAPGESVGVRESLPIEALGAPRPPLLPDLLDDRLSAEVIAPRTRSVIVVQALEVTEAVLD